MGIILYGGGNCIRLRYPRANVVLPLLRAMKVVRSDGHAFVRRGGLLSRLVGTLFGLAGLTAMDLFLCRLDGAIAGWSALWLLRIRYHGDDVCAMVDCDCGGGKDYGNGGGDDDKDMSKCAWLCLRARACVNLGQCAHTTDNSYARPCVAVFPHNTQTGSYFLGAGS